MKQIDDNTYELSTGTKIYANNGLIGMNAELDAISEGYDGFISYGLDRNDLTKGEMIEVADYMVVLWSSFKSKVLGLLETA